VAGAPVIPTLMPDSGVRIVLQPTIGPSASTCIGRERELTLLQQALWQKQTTLACVIAPSGVGKTTLVQEWMNRLRQANGPRTRCIFGWSFQGREWGPEREDSEDRFLDQALESLAVVCDSQTPSWEKGRRLADEMRRQGAVLVLDGVEPFQHSSGPMRGRLRAPGMKTLLRQLSIDHGNDESERTCLCVITTREAMTDLTEWRERASIPWGPVLEISLENLPEDVGGQLLYGLGVRRCGSAVIGPDDAELRAASREMNGHALGLNLLGRFICQAQEGDIGRRDRVIRGEPDADSTIARIFRILAAFESWFSGDGPEGASPLMLLRMLGLFESAAPLQQIEALLRAPAIEGLTTSALRQSVGTLSGETLKETLQRLRACGLLEVVADGSLHGHYFLDTHPLIRQYFAESLATRNPEAFRLAHRTLYDFLCDSTTDFSRPTLQQLEPLYQAIAHGCYAGMHQEVCVVVFRQRIRRGRDAYTLHELGAFSTELAALACFFQDGWELPSPELRAPERSWLLNEVGYCLRALGRVAEGLLALETAVQANLAQRLWRSAAAAAVNLSESKLLAGDVVGAVADADHAVRLADYNYAGADGDDDGFMSLYARSAKAEALHQAGQRHLAMSVFAKTEILQEQYEPEFPELYSVQGFRYCDLLLGRAEYLAWKIQLGLISDSWAAYLQINFTRGVEVCAGVEGRATRALEYTDGNLGILTTALDHLTLGRALLYRGMLEPLCTSAVSPATPGPMRVSPDIHEAEQHLVMAVNDLQRAGAQHWIANALLSRAWLYSVTGDTEGAKRDIDTSWMTAQTGGLRLQMADVLLHRVRLFCGTRPYPWCSLGEDLEAARALIRETGYARRTEELGDAEYALRPTKAL
jgi:tetratricopeptide (TPR) repeat protein